MEEKNNFGEQKERGYVWDWLSDFRWIPAAGLDVMGAIPWIFGMEDIVYAPVQTSILAMLYSPELVKLKDSSKSGILKVGGMYAASFLEELGAITDPIPTGLIYHSIATSVNRNYRKQQELDEGQLETTIKEDYRP